MAAQRTFPRHTLEEALRVPRAIKDYNGGNPWPSPEVAKAMGQGPRSSTFFYVTAASRDYGLTEGTRDTAVISLTELGVRAVSPQTDAEQRQAYLEAFQRVEVFRRVLHHYGGSNLPDKPYLSNTLAQTFGIDPKYHDDLAEVYTKNCRFLGIGAQFTGSGQMAVLTGATGPTGPQTAGGAITVATADDAENAPVLFVIMPFAEKWDEHQTGFFQEVLDELFVPAGKDAGFTVRTARRQGSDVIQSTIVNELLDAQLVLADLTEHNPNVLFELGLRMHADLPIALVKARGTGRIFDVDHMLRVEEYDPNLWTSTVKNDLPIITDHIRAAWDSRETAPTFMKILRPQGQQ